MKRALLGLAVAGAAFVATAPPASADGIEYCGITPRYPCGYCQYDPTTGKETCVGLRYIEVG
jgi:hypothetical protein